MIGMKTLTSSSSDEWTTPQDLYDRLDAEFHFTLDPCATDDNHKCDRYCTKETDGLSLDWGGRQYSATLLIPGSLPGSGRHSMKARKTIRWSLC